MAKIYGVILISISIFCNNAFAQNINVRGRVRDKETSIGLCNVIIKLYNRDAIVYSTASDSLGYFGIPPDYYKQGDHIVIHSLNFDDLWVKTLPPINAANHLLGVFDLIRHNIQLQDIKINAKRRYRDTTKIDLSNEKFERSVMIDDLFSTRGFYKDSKGELYFNGRHVSDIMVNGGDFFGKKNMDIYQLLPALVLDKIEVVETNIDDQTNTTTQDPTIRINLKLKEKYNKGAFGNASTGMGTAKRYLIGSDMYTYKNKEQISFGFNTNNINISELPAVEPLISFSANGNNSITHNAKFSYRNILSKKLEISFSARGKIDHRDYLSDVERQEENTNQFSKIINQSKTRQIGMPEARLILNYKIDSLNTLTFIQTNNHIKTTQTDLSNYQINVGEINTVSNLNRSQNIVNNTSLSELSYTHKFAKAGRSWNIAISRQHISIENNESDSVYNLTGQLTKAYFVKGDRNSGQNTFNISTAFTEPLGTEAYINMFAKYRNDEIDYHPNIISDSLKNIQNTPPVAITNQYIQTGIKLQKMLKRFAFDGSLQALFNIRHASTMGNVQRFTVLNINADAKVDYKIDNKKSYSISYKKVTNYPVPAQLININNSFDLISQISGNPGIKPELKNSIRFDYNINKSGTESFNLTAGFDAYSNKFGQVINYSPNTPQSVYDTNLGNAKAATAGFSVVKNISDKIYLNYSGNFSYIEQPTIVNSKLNLNSGVTINQALTTGKEIIKNILSVTPTFATSYSRYLYESSSINMLTLTYSDKFSFTAFKFQLELYPLINYNHSISTTTSLSVNGALKRNVFKKYGTIWLQGYDLFNSFKYNNNFIGASYTQTVKYSNIKRYFIMGLSLRFNNIK
ncbi:outer membrane beta-barrel protein [Mucilaginibacter oryzae]|uniref:Outer membrane beta-barrel protein n=1 Tax=Mucilaginibacter oryzae TaxID=468058 RepID=A0A316HJS2_9SPHI|nr:outer membrane beta-barrel protein [Mucilaginibacter oryzae]PWK74195.1 outer membrane beta-barrel protein [Mucilaginibacter oryzae]